MKVEEISANKIQENPWNPNEMGERLYQALVRDIRENGFVQPILVRKQGKAYEIVDGAHRLRALKEAGMDKAPCVVVEAGDDEAKLRTITMNHLRGEMNIVKLAALVKDLSERYTLKQLEEMTGYGEVELKDHLLVLKDPDFEKAFEGLKGNDEVALEEMNFVLTPEIAAAVKPVIEKIKKELKPRYSGEVLHVLCDAYGSDN